MKTPPIKKTCPECKIYEGIEFSRIQIKDPSNNHDCELKICPTCKGTREVYNYLTPEQWETETGEKMLDTDRVWVRAVSFEPVKKFHWVNYSYNLPKDVLDHWRNWPEEISKEIVVARPGQPKPDDSWRPE